MTRSRVAALAAVATMVAAGTGSATAATPARAQAIAPGAVAHAATAAAGRCATSPTGLRFTRAAPARTGRLSWMAPASPAGAALTYQVFKDGRRAGRTSALAAPVAVRPGHRYRFSVAVVGDGGLQGTVCRASRSITIRFMPPARPRGLGISISARRAVLAWRASRPGDGRLAGYRVYRDATMLRRVRGTRATVTIRPGAPQRLSVRAVDARGNRSVAATISTASSKEAPQAPAGLRAVAVTETTATLAWRPATAGTGRVVGYRVFRDGRTLGQVAATQIAVPRLDTAHAYTFTVAAVDNRGNVSPPSRALTIATNAPPPSTGSLHAFVLTSTGASFEDFKAHYRQIGTLHATYFECNHASAAVQGHDIPQITSFAKLRQVEVFARFDCQYAPALHRILTEPALRGAWLTTIVAQAIEHDYDGVNVDFETGAPGDRAAYTSFVTELAARMHAIGKKVAVDVSPKTADDPGHSRSGLYDYPALAAEADVVFVMAWGIHWATSEPGPIVDMAWLQSVVHYVNTLPDRDKYVMGTPLYGMDWPRPSGAGAPARALEWTDIAGLSARVGVPAVFDATAGEAHFTYVDAAGVRHQVWASSAAAVLARMRLFAANEYAIGVWRLGREDMAMWSDPLLAG